MALRIGDTAPDFTAPSTKGEISFHQHLGTSWGVLFSHPRDYTPVCTTELGRVAALAPEFARRDVKTYGLSVDPVEDHQGWIGDIDETQGVKMDFPLIGDPNRTVAELYDMIHPGESETATVRSVFVIDPDKKIRVILTYPMSSGRNFDEILRIIDSLQVTTQHGVATPVDWSPGDRCIVPPHVTTDEARAKFPSGVDEVKPYLRYVADPSS